jgi:ABC-type sugar transport system, permease component
MFKTQYGFSRKVFLIINFLLLAFVCFLVLLPLWNIIITSLAQDADVQAGKYLLVPRSFTLKAYLRIFHSGYIRSFYNSIGVAVFGTIFSMIITLPMAFSLAQKNLVARKFFMGFVVVTLMFDAGMIPLYVVVKNLHLINTYAALVLPIALSSFNLIVMKNFFTSIPESLIESARLDGCNDAKVLTSIVLPVSIPIIAAITLFYFVHYWNRYFDVVMFINDNKKQTIQILLRTLIFEPESSVTGGEGVYNNTKMAVMMMGMLPVMILYPFIQKYFVSGLMLGSIKG